MSYIGDMKQSNSNGVEAQGAETQEIPEISQIEKWLTEDIGRCLTLLHAIHNDAELRHQMAIFFQGRINNFKNRPDPSQTDLFRK